MSSDQMAPHSISSSARNHMIVIYILYLFGLFTLTPVIAGAIVAYVKRGDFMEPDERSHFDAAITTFWGLMIFTGISQIPYFFFSGAALANQSFSDAMPAGFAFWLGTIFSMFGWFAVLILTSSLGWFWGLYRITFGLIKIMEYEPVRYEWWLRLTRTGVLRNHPEPS